MISKDHIKQINLEQKRQIEIYKWIESEKAGHDLSVEAEIAWVDKYARDFRAWVETIPFECKNCGLCPSDCNREECKDPFNEERLRRINID